MLPWLGKRRKHKGNRDIWLRTELEILQVAEVLGLHEPRYRREKRWEWVIGDSEGLSLDLSRATARSRVPTSLSRSFAATSRTSVKDSSR